MTKNNNVEYFFFELFCIDPADIKSETALAQALSFSHNLWGDKIPKIDTEKARIRIKEEVSGINIIIMPVDTSNVITSYFESAFMINVFGDSFETIENFRLKLLRHLKNTLQFSSIRLLTDDVSTYIANKLYPEINKVENLLRKYLMKFFIQRIGTDWWETTATRAMIEKARLRRLDRKDEITMFIDDELRYIDFDDLGELVYKQSSGYNNPDKIVSRLYNIERIEDFFNLKNELQSNYTKYFKENFQDKMFEQKWKDIIKLRNKVAHQGIFYKNEMIYGLDTLNSLTEIINNAERKIDEVVFSIEDKQAIRNATIEATQMDEPINLEGLKILGKMEFPDTSYKTFSKYIDISEHELLAELDELQSSKWTKYIGLKWFVTEYLANKNYNIATTYSLVNIMIDKGIIEKYEVPSPNGYVIIAIRLNEEEFVEE